MYIGEVANKTGLTIKAIRFYEEKGLIHPPQRLGRYRVYKDSDIEVLNLIKEAKEMGVTLSQLSHVIEYKKGVLNWVKINAFLIDLKQQFTMKIHDLNHKIEKIDLCVEQINS